MDEQEQTTQDLRYKYKAHISELERLYPASFTIRQSDLTNNKVADYVVNHKHIADGIVKNSLLELGVPEKLVNEIIIRYIGLPSVTPIRGLTSRYIGQNRTFDGIIRRVSEVKSKAIVASFECSSCTARTTEVQDSSTITYPDSKCPICSKSARWKVIPEGGKYIDYEEITVQEYPEGMRGGEQPKSVVVTLTSDLCGTVLPGNRVIVCGVLKLKQAKFEKELIFIPFVEGNSVILKEENYENINITDEDLKKIKALGKSPNVIERIAKSIAPTVYGNDEVKRGIALQLFGGVVKEIEHTRIRGDIHVLLIGDPGIAKSVILKYVADISPRGIFTHGNSASKAGLTATAIKDNDQWVLEAGALVLADLGLCAVDELDKMGDEDREALHGAMEQQEINVAKAGIVARLLCRCSLLAAANPKMGRFDQCMSLSAQFNLPPTLVSRFDLIYPMSDIPEEEKDSETADHILATHTTRKISEDVIATDTLRKYIAHAKTINPVLTKEATEQIKEYYTKVRGLANNMHTVPITARSLEALIRLSEAAARMRLSDVITADDTKLVVSIVDACLRQIAYDSTTNTFDADRIIGRYPKKMRDAFSRITDGVLMTCNFGGISSVGDVTKYVKDKYGIVEQETLAYIEVMKSETRLITPKEGYIKVLK